MLKGRHRTSATAFQGWHRSWGCVTGKSRGARVHPGAVRRLWDLPLGWRLGSGLDHKWIWSHQVVSRAHHPRTGSTGSASAEAWTAG